MVAGGVGIGLILAWIFVQAHKRLPTDAPSDIALTLVEPYLIYWVAEQIHSSGVLAVVAAGLYMSSRNLTFLNSGSRVMGYSVWESFVFILNGVVFLIIGLQLPQIVDGLEASGIPLKTAIGYGVLVTGVIIIVRILSSYAALLATFIFRPAVAPRFASKKRIMMLPMLLGWTGMRGVVSLAAALAIPVQINGADFPYRNLILFITFVVILLTLVIQGLTLPILIKRSKVFDEISEEPDEEFRKKMKIGLREQSYLFLKDKYENEPENDVVMQKILQHWEEKTKAGDQTWMNDKIKSILIETLEVQRKYLTELNKDPEINEEIIRTQLYQIDLEEERLKIV
jgi:NhaP-type Na+/H+ or K+/H+ antiporter